jgi:radical SAM family RiPP maturation amino acid epimerase
MSSALAEKLREILGRRSAEERRTLAHVKRFIERFIADAQFRDKLRDNADASQHVTHAYGIDIDPRQALPLFSVDHMRFRFSAEAARWPLTKVWDDYVGDLREYRSIYRQAGDCPDANPRFHAWRQRQMCRAYGELGGALASGITHPILAFELSAGCTVGCWFCGISAERFRGNFLYTRENANLWHEILKQSVDLFGSAAQSGFCYWGTDPSDNPDYPKFIEDYYATTGLLPQTTTAVPLKNMAVTREVMRLGEKYGCVINRFSILNLKMLEQVHAAFSAEELLAVDLVLQNRESLTSKALVGRAKERQQKLEGAGKPASIAVQSEQSTIACASGFLVNMVERTIKLMSPTRGSERWPLGYRIFGERGFADAREFRSAVEELIAAHMPDEVASTDIVAFREDLTYHRKPGAFELRTANAQFSLGGFTGAGRLGDLIHKGDKTAGEIQETLTRSGADIFVTADAMQTLFDHGLLNEDPKLGGIGSGAPREERRVRMAPALAAVPSPVA